MLNCEHITTTKKVISKEYFGEKFTADTDVCEACGAELWNQEVQNNLNEWLGALDKSKRDRFTLQLNLTEPVLKCSDKLLKDFPNVDRAKILRAMVMFYVEKVSIRPDWMEKFEHITEREVFTQLQTGPKALVKVHFSPFALLDINSLAGFADLKPRELAEAAILRIFSFYIEHDSVMREFWLTQILPDISLILKAG